MKKDNQIKDRLSPYIQAIPDIFNYQIVTKALICVWLFLSAGVANLFMLHGVVIDGLRIRGNHYFGTCRPVRDTAVHSEDDPAVIFIQTGK